MRFRNIIYNSRRLQPILHKPVRLLALRNYTNSDENSLTIVGVETAITLAYCRPRGELRNHTNREASGASSPVEITFAIGLVFKI